MSKNTKNQTLEELLKETLINGVPRLVDSVGRITLPKAWRKVLKIKENTTVEIFRLGDGIFIRPLSVEDSITCRVCNTQVPLEETKVINQRHICLSCFLELSQEIKTDF